MQLQCFGQPPPLEPVVSVLPYTARELGCCDCKHSTYNHLLIYVATGVNWLTSYTQCSAADRVGRCRKESQTYTAMDDMTLLFMLHGLYFTNTLPILCICCTTICFRFIISGQNSDALVLT